MMESWFGRTVRKSARRAHALGSVVLALMVLFIAASVIFRYFFNRPIIGDFEVVQLMLGLVLAFSLAETSLKKGHVQVELLVSRFPPRIKHALHAVITFICMIFLALMIWQNVLYVMESMREKEITSSLFIPYYPFIAALALSLILFWFALLVDLVESFRKVVSRDSF